MAGTCISFRTALCPGKRNVTLIFGWSTAPKAAGARRAIWARRSTATENEWHPTLAADATLCFGSDRPGGKGATDIYCSRLVDRKSEVPKNLGDSINTEFDEYEPFIAPDKSYLIFMAAGRPDSHSRSNDLYLSRQQNGAWTPRGFWEMRSIRIAKNILRRSLPTASISSFQARACEFPRRGRSAMQLWCAGCVARATDWATFTGSTSLRS